MSEIVSKSHGDSLCDEAAAVLVDAYLTNPLNMAIFGGSGEKERGLNRAVFEIMLQHAVSGERLVARSGDHVVGFAKYARSPDCRPTSERLSAAVPLLAHAVGEALPRLATWRRAWDERDPE